MGKKNDFLARQKNRESVIQQATRQTHEQYITDMFVLALNDPDVMGKDTLGYVRLKRVLAGVGKYYDKFFDALTKNAEADYARAKMDEALERICGPDGDFIPFEKRYDWLPEITYGKK